MIALRVRHHFQRIVRLAAPAFALHPLRFRLRTAPILEVSRRNASDFPAVAAPTATAAAATTPPTASAAPAVTHGPPPISASGHDTDANGDSEHSDDDILSSPASPRSSAAIAAAQKAIAGLKPHPATSSHFPMLPNPQPTQTHSASPPHTTASPKLQPFRIQSPTVLPSASTNHRQFTPLPVYTNPSVQALPPNQSLQSLVTPQTLSAVSSSGAAGLRVPLSSTTAAVPSFQTPLIR